MSERLPLTVVTGFLGSGKTTLVKRFLASPGAAGTGLVVNEFGEIGVDHHLFVHAAEHVELIARGRARRADVSRALHDLVRQSKSGTEPIRRIVIETSGLADPAPVVAVLAEDPWLKAHVALASIIAVVDAVAGPENLSRFVEAQRQVAVADMVVVTKGDLRKARPIDQIERQVRALSADLPVLDAQDPGFSIEAPFSDTFRLRELPSAAAAEFPAPGEDSDIRSFVLHPQEPVDWPAFTVWLSALLHAHGERILRVKGLLRTSAAAGPLAVHGVQHIMHPPSHLDPGECADTPSFLVFIARGLAAAEIERSYRRFLHDYVASGGTEDRPASREPMRSF